MLVAYSYYCHLLILIGHPCNKMNVAGFPFGCKYKIIFSKELQKSDEKPIKLNANVCITVQNVWEHKTCEYDISA